MHPTRSEAGWRSATRTVADAMLGLVILTVFWLVGEVIALLLPWSPLSGSLWGMLAMFVALASGVLPERRVRRASALLVRWLGLLFVPVGVAVVVFGELVVRHAGAIAAAIVIGSVLTLLASAAAATWTAGRGPRRTP